jgi:ribosomal RNA assembly protein
MEHFQYTLKIPKERIAVLIGKKGTDKRKIEKAMGVKLHIDSKEGEIRIEGEDALNLFAAREICRAISRGFNPDVAMQLQKQDYALEIISLRGRTVNEMHRLKGRIIGEGGKSRTVIEDLTGSYIVVYGKTIGLIGEFEPLRDARKAVEMLVQGANHASVYRLLERKRRSRRSFR